MKVPFLHSRAGVPGGPEDEEVPVGGQNGKWPERPANPVSQLQMGKERLRERKGFF